MDVSFYSYGKIKCKKTSVYDTRKVTSTEGQSLGITVTGNLLKSCTPSKVKFYRASFVRTVQYSTGLRRLYNLICDLLKMNIEAYIFIITNNFPN